MTKNKVTIIFVLMILFLLPCHVFAKEIEAKQVVELSNRESIFVIMDNGDLWAWGDNTSGQLGAGDIKKLEKPQKIMTGVKEVSGVDLYNATWAYILKYDGSLWGVGSNIYGQLLDDKLGIKYTPIKIMDNCREITGRQIVKNDGSGCSININRQTKEAYNRTNDISLIRYELVGQRLEDLPYDPTVILNSKGIFNRKLMYGSEILYESDKIIDIKVGSIFYHGGTEDGIHEFVACLLDKSGELNIFTEKQKTHHVSDNVKQILPDNYFITKDNTFCKWEGYFGTIETFESSLKIKKYCENVRAVSDNTRVFLDNKGVVYKFIYNSSNKDKGSYETIEKLFEIPLPK
ncbi:MAG: hypothetical protein PHY44_03815 [Lachnospiraceae bacterium]|nr:hypothetical protein [Lachnospiraceae bacterium]